MTPRSLIRWLHLFLGLSGAAGLGLQLTWTRRFALGLGHELPATLAVVTAFFIGIAVGAWALDAPIRRSTNPSRWCAGLEAVIGLWALVTVLLVPAANTLALEWIGLGPSPLRHWAVAFGLPGLVLLPATVAMGATLPAAERLATGWTGNPSTVASLYAANTFGAVIGVCASVWWTMPALGLSRATIVFGLINLVSAAGFAIAGRAAHCRADEHSQNPPRSASDRQASRRADGEGRGLEVILFVTGLAGIGFEVIGVRLLSQALENTVYTYAAALLVYLLGTAAGAAWWHRQATVRNLPRAWLLLGTAVACVAGTIALAHAPEWFEALRAAWGDHSEAVLAAEAAVAASVFLPATILMGMVFSHLLQAARAGSGVGRAVALNTLGGALAPLFFGIGLFPWLGGRISLGFVATAYLALSAWQSEIEAKTAVHPAPAKSGSGSTRRRNLRLWLTEAALVAGFFILVPTQLDLQRLPPGATLVSLREGAADTVAVLQNTDGHRVLRVNNRFSMGGTASTNAERRHSHLPLLLHPAPRRALFLGLGTGISFAAMNAHPGLEADGVELVPEVVDSMPDFAPHNGFSPRLQIHVADARRYVRTTTNRYDVIVADLFHPARDGAGSLYTLEHFRSLRAALEPGGLFCQWLPLFQLDEITLRMIVRTWLEVFPEGQAFLLRPNVDTPVLGLISWPANRGYDLGRMDQRLTLPTLRGQLKPLLLVDDLSLLGSWFADTAALRRLAADAPLNTDDHPRVVFAAPIWNFRRSVPSYALLELLLAQSRGVPDGLLARPGSDSGRDESFPSRLRAYTGARDQYLRGLMAQTEGKSVAALDAFLDSAKMSPDFTSGYAQILARATQRAQVNPPEARRLLERLIEVRPERPVARELLERLTPR